MSGIPDYDQNLSLKMSEVMDMIGVNEKMVVKRRKIMLLNESLFELSINLRGIDANWLIFGSQIEGTTTQGLKSDADSLVSINTCNVIQDWSEWESGKRNALMIQDENVSPGYCLLQLLRSDVPQPHVHVVNRHSYRDRMGRILLQNTYFNDAGYDCMLHGPAQTTQGLPGFSDNDLVPAFLVSQSGSVHLQHWLHQHREGHWPTNDMIQFCGNTGCFLVGVGKKGSIYEAFEWRISTSLAERCFMFNLNITQIRCYVLMKMILKTFITQRFPDSISSFMCKTVLLHCISFTRSDTWKENTLFTCISFCLSTLYNCVQNEYCPHFIITQNNLMSGNFSLEKKPLILEKLRYVIESNGRAFLEIECDNFGSSVQTSLNGFVQINAHCIQTLIVGLLLSDAAQNINAQFKVLLLELNDLSPRLMMKTLLTFMSHHNNADFTNEAYRLIRRHLCTTLGSVLASLNINQQDHFTYKMALSFMSLGLDSDVSSGKLKLASMFYCTGDIERTELILKNIEQCYDISVVEPVCKCYDYIQAPRKERFNGLCYESNEECTLLKHLTASCVCFIRCEINCCPLELQHDMFRSAQEGFAHRSDDDKWDKWMDIAAVDSLPFLYFLQYKTYSRLGRQDDKQKALSNIARTIDVEPNLGHRETALNFLGQCMEEENNVENAFKCYALSLQIRRQNKSAKLHICMLLNKLINN